ncbi:1-phosphofructokinase family hexose kinase [Galactobacter valiniphilus]|uniref:1-phosphofructokinase family hexose kinase n=1 Tax=Galactobacter valiniphilus TaxID=2676122 RepID=UPI0037364BBD
MIVCITPAPALDATITVGALELGESLRVPAASVRAGGKGINVARILHGAGHAVLSLSTRGGEAGRRLSAELEGAGVPCAWVETAGETRSSTALVEDSGRTTVLNEYAPALSEAEWAAWEAALLVAAREARAATISGSWPAGADSARLARAVQLLNAAGVYTVVDTSGPLLLTAAEAGADLLKPNLEELLAATGAATAEEGVAALLALGAGSVLLSRGAEGMSHHTRADPVGIRASLGVELRGNPTGAGDAGVAGWLSVAGPLGAAPEGADRALALRTAVAWSASAVQAPVAGQLGPDAAAFLERVSVD